MLVKEIMVSDPIVITCSDNLHEAERLMRINAIGRLIVVDCEERVVGVITDGDLTCCDDFNRKVGSFMTDEVIKINQDYPIQEAARLMSDCGIGGLPVVDDNDNLVGVITAEDIVSGYVKEEKKQEEKPKISPESAAIYLAMTRSRDYEKYWLDKLKNYNYSGAITQTGAKAEKLPTKLRESITVAAIARGVIRENSREKMAVSLAVRDAYLQLNIINPGLGGGFKLAIVRGQGHVSVAIFGKFGHALVDGPEQLAIGTSVI